MRIAVQCRTSRGGMTTGATLLCALDEELRCRSAEPDFVNLTVVVRDGGVGELRVGALDTRRDFGLALALHYLHVRIANDQLALTALELRSVQRRFLVQGDAVYRLGVGARQHEGRGSDLRDTHRCASLLREYRPFATWSLGAECRLRNVFEVYGAAKDDESDRAFRLPVNSKVIGNSSEPAIRAPLRPK